MIESEKIMYNNFLMLGFINFECTFEIICELLEKLIFKTTN